MNCPKYKKLKNETRKEKKISNRIGLNESQCKNCSWQVQLPRALMPKRQTNELYAHGYTVSIVYIWTQNVYKKYSFHFWKHCAGHGLYWDWENNPTEQHCSKKEYEYSNKDWDWKRVNRRRRKKQREKRHWKKAQGNSKHWIRDAM